MGVVHTGIDDGDDNVIAARSQVPGRNSLDIGFCLPCSSHDHLTGVLHIPLPGKIGIIGNAVHPEPVVGLCILNVRFCCIAFSRDP